MMSTTHAIFSVTLTSISLGTANPSALTLAAVGSQIPDCDTSKSMSGRILLPISRWVESRFPHRTITHSFVATLAVGILASPFLIWQGLYWQALVLGFFYGWFADVFTKSGVTAFWPSSARLVIPGNPKLRIATNTPAEWILGVVLLGLGIFSININSSGGLLRAFNQTLGIPAGAVELVNLEGDQFQLFAQVNGRNPLTQQAVTGEYEVIKTLTVGDLLLRQGQALYRAGRSQNSQIQLNRVQIRRGNPIQSQIQEFRFQEEDLSALAQLPFTTLLSGSLQVQDAEDLVILPSVQEFNPLTTQPLGNGIVLVRVESASPQTLMSILGNYTVTGQLLARIVHVY